MSERKMATEADKLAIESFVREVAPFLECITDALGKSRLNKELISFTVSRDGYVSMDFYGYDASYRKVDKKTSGKITFNETVEI